MHRRFVFALAVMTFLLLAAAENALAQSDTPKFELGVHYALLRFSDVDATGQGAGFRFTYNFTDYIAADVVFNHFPKRRDNVTEPIQIDNSVLLALFGGKFGYRGESVGIFGKLRPGFIYFSGIRDDPRIINPLLRNFDPNTMNYALDFGAVIEFYFSRLISLRFDVGDTVIRYRISSTRGTTAISKSNLLFTMGVGFRF
ncbi:MAG: outer membrane beta-barrel protein [Acidobacteria bacterium]|nr:outer membrane beta-barrel protein [Acidobacteriota bacterium]